MEIELTNAQRAIIHALILKEAKEMGYGENSKYNHWNKTIWPRRLKQLAAIADKFRPPVQPVPRTKEQNIAFRKEWDARVVAAAQEAQMKEDIAKMEDGDYV